MAEYQEAGVDQVIFIQQAGRNKHEHIMDSLRLFASDVKPFVTQDQAERDRRKQEDLAPYIEAALKRKKWMAPMPADAVPLVQAYGKTVVASTQETEKPTYRIGTAGGFEVPMEDLLEKARNAAE